MSSSGSWRTWPRTAGRLEGVVYVTGEVVLPAERRLHIVEGALVTEDTIQVERGATLEVTHSATTRTLPGVIVLEPGRFAVGRGARVAVHGLVYASRVFDMIHGARFTVVGSVIGADPVISVNILASTAIVRYDPAVLGTRGLRTPAGTPVIAWVSAWEELP